MTDEQRNKRIHHHLYEEAKSPLENAERIVALEELVMDLWEHVSKADRLMWPELSARMADLGVKA